MKTFSLITIAALLAAATPAFSIDVASGETPQAVVAADFNKDGRQDLAFANAFDDTVSVHFQNSSGDFPLSLALDVGKYPGILNDFPRYLSCLDVNRDGFPDLIVLCSGDPAFGFEPSIQTLFNLENGAFAAIDAISTSASHSSGDFPVQFSVGEFSGDHYPDLAVANLEGLTVPIMEGNGTGVFSLGQVISVNTRGNGPQDLIVRDLDGDGLDDLLVVTSSAFLCIMQTAAGEFASPVEYSLPVAGVDLRAGVVDDLNGDGALDAALADAAGRILFLYGMSSNGGLTSSRAETSPSLSGCSDVGVIYWDGDTRPDIVVTNRTGDSLTVLCSTGSTDVIPAGALPRRLAIGDLDGDGLLDIVTANEGDLSQPNNPDGSIALNPGPQTTDQFLTLTEETPLAGLLAGEVPHPAGLARVPGSSRMWVIENSRRFIHEVDEDRVLGRRLKFNFEVGGIQFTGGSEGWVVERFAPVIWRFEIESSSHIDLEGSKSFSQDPGGLGFCGLAYRSETDQFFVSDPGNERILRINEEGESVLEIAASPSAWNLAWDEDSNRLLLTNPGRSDVRACSSSGSPDQTRSFDMAPVSALFKETGIAGVSCGSDDGPLRLITTEGLMLRTTTSGTVLKSSSMSPLSGTMGFDIDKRDGDLYTLSQDGFVKRLPYPGFDHEEMISLWPSFEADPRFLPAGIAVDETNDRILVGDRHRPLIARFTRSGDFDGFIDFSGSVGVGTGPISGLEHKDSTGAVYFRNHGGVVSTQTSTPLVIPEGPCGDIGMDDAWLAAILPNPCEVLARSLLPDSQTKLGMLPAAAVRGGLAFDSYGNLIQLETGPVPVLRKFSLFQQSAVQGWELYK